MPRPLFARGAHGFLINRLQQSLATDGHYTGNLDGDFGGGTERAVASFQRTSRLAPTGRADDVTWRRVTHTSIPSLFERCLQLTASLEGHGFGIVQGNFDGAGLTWGLIGFTLSNGEIARLVLAAQAAQPAVVLRAFGDRTTELLTRMRQPLARQVAWGDSLSSGRYKTVVAEPWRSAFARFGAEPLVQTLQIQRAHDVYYANAVALAGTLGLASELGAALCFDIAVQNGGLRSAAKSEITRRWAAARPKREPALRLIVAEAVANAAKARWRSDVLERKGAIARGEGSIHGAAYRLEGLGLTEARAEF